jgi:hypothetical protein
MTDIVISGLVSAKPLTSGAADSAQVQKIKHTAQEFEAVLLRQMMREMRNSVFSESSKGGSNATYLGLADEQLANNMAAQGGFGIWQANGPTNDPTSAGRQVNRSGCQCRKTLKILTANTRENKQPFSTAPRPDFSPRSRACWRPQQNVTGSSVDGYVRRTSSVRVNGLSPTSLEHHRHILCRKGFTRHILTTGCKAQPLSQQSKTSYSQALTQSVAPLDAMLTEPATSIATALGNFFNAAGSHCQRTQQFCVSTKPDWQCTPGGRSGIEVWPMR